MDKPDRAAGPLAYHHVLDHLSAKTKKTLETPD